MENYLLNDGNLIPKLGFGTWQSKNGEEAYQAVKTALKVGYRHIDTAAIYGNEESVGQAIRDSGIDRKEIFVTTKLWNNVGNYQEAREAIDTSLEKLGLDFVDLYLIHWPNPLAFRENWEERNRSIWKAMEEAVAAGKIRSIGVSNFLPNHLEALLKTARIKPSVNQIRLSPGIYQKEVVDFCNQNDILIEAWSPFGQGDVFNHPFLKELAEKYQTSVAKFVLTWSLQQGFLPLPKSVTPKRIESNFDAFGVTISDEDMDKLTNLKIESSAPNPDQVDF